MPYSRFLTSIFNYMTLLFSSTRDFLADTFLTQRNVNQNFDLECGLSAEELKLKRQYSLIDIPDHLIKCICQLMLDSNNLSGVLNLRATSIAFHQLISSFPLLLTRYGESEWQFKNLDQEIAFVTYTANNTNWRYETMTVQYRHNGMSRRQELYRNHSLFFKAKLKKLRFSDSYPYDSISFRHCEQIVSSLCNAATEVQLEVKKSFYLKPYSHFYSHVTMLDITVDYQRSSSAVQLLHCCPHIRVLRLYTKSPEIEIHLGHLREMSKLRELQLHGFSIMDTGSTHSWPIFPHLTRLDVNGWSGSNKNHLILIAHSFPRLEALKYFNTSIIAELEIPDLVLSCHTLNTSFSFFADTCRMMRLENLFLTIDASNDLKSCLSIINTQENLRTLCIGLTSVDDKTCEQDTILFSLILPILQSHPCLELFYFYETFGYSNLEARFSHYNFNSLSQLMSNHKDLKIFRVGTTNFYQNYNKIDLTFMHRAAFFESFSGCPLVSTYSVNENKNLSNTQEIK